LSIETIREIFNSPQSLNQYPTIWTGAIIFLLFAGAFSVLLLVFSFIFRINKPERVKNSPYECGVDPVGDARNQYMIKYYLIAMLFVAFDVETIFMYPWAVQFNLLGQFGFIEMVIFILILGIGYIYAYKKGALDWSAIEQE
jgi:NADH-quinone oxidoreductase subunit A